MNAIDTNIWIYAHDVRDPDKQARALVLIRDTDPLALPWQVDCEFIAATRKLEPMGFRREDAWTTLADMQGMAELLLIPTPDLWITAPQIQSETGLSFWDALLAAACLQGGVHTHFSPKTSGISKRSGNCGS